MGDTNNTAKRLCTAPVVEADLSRPFQDWANIVYDSFYNFAYEPFAEEAALPTPFLPSERQRLIAALATDRMDFSVSAVVGAKGVGKSTIARLLLSWAKEERVARLVTAQSGDSALDLAATAFGLTLGAEIGPFLAASHAQDISLQLLVDDADRLSDEHLQELLALFTPAVPTSLHVVLFGSPELGRRVLQLSDGEGTIPHVHTLRPFTAEDTEAYLTSRLSAAGWKGDPSFSAGAYRRIHRASGGLARTVNSLTRHLLGIAEQQRLHAIDEALVERALNGLKRPAPSPVRAAPDEAVAGAGVATKMPGSGDEAQDAATIERLAASLENLKQQETAMIGIERLRPERRMLDDPPPDFSPGSAWYDRDEDPEEWDDDRPGRDRAGVASGLLMFLFAALLLAIGGAALAVYSGWVPPELEERLRSLIAAPPAPLWTPWL